MKKKGVCALLALALICFAAFEAGATGRQELTPGGGRQNILCVRYGHDWEIVSALGATCTSAAVYKSECTRCGETKSETVGEPMDHEWLDDGTVYPTCTEKGLEKMHCMMCGKVWTNEIPALGHSWKTLRTIRKATCTQGGSREVECANCGKIDTRTTEATGHTWEDTGVITEPTCTREGKMGTVCEDCGKTGSRTLEKSEHIAEEWTITKAATETAKGTRTGVCVVCGKKVTQSYERAQSEVEIYTTAGKVNLRKGPSRDKDRVLLVEKSGTYLGRLLETDVDKNGTVWFKVRYKNKNGWVMADYAQAVARVSDPTQERLPEATGKELSSYFLKSFAPTAAALNLEETYISAEAVYEWANHAVYMFGWNYVENIELSDEGYTLFGVKVGDRIAAAQKTLKNKGLVLTGEGGDEYVYGVPCLPDALGVEENGFCAMLYVIVNEENRVQEIQLYAEVSADW